VAGTEPDRAVSHVGMQQFLDEAGRGLLRTQVAAAWAAGRAMTWRQAIGEALQETPVP
jgi:hypothetical protein